MKENIVLVQKRICETKSGKLAYTIGPLAFRSGRPMLVRHAGGIFLEHDLQGKVLTEGYGPEYDIIHVRAEETTGSLTSLTRQKMEMQSAVYASGAYQ